MVVESFRATLAKKVRGAEQEARPTNEKLLGVLP
jgi:hypothetical protein